MGYRTESPPPHPPTRTAVRSTADGGPTAAAEGEARGGDAEPHPDCPTPILPCSSFIRNVSAANGSSARLEGSLASDAPPGDAAGAGAGAAAAATGAGTEEEEEVVVVDAEAAEEVESEVASERAGEAPVDGQAEATADGDGGRRSLRPPSLPVAAGSAFGGSGRPEAGDVGGGVAQALCEGDAAFSTSGGIFWLVYCFIIFFRVLLLCCFATSNLAWSCTPMKYRYC
eukprot:Rhum_TRINITY_DN14618_c3_g1::Rhum_TRINITY_DN14618_c3_g1_i1::g.105922::m.105922